VARFLWPTVYNDVGYASLVNSKIRSVLQFQRQNIISVTQMLICSCHWHVPVEFFLRLILS